MEKVYSRYKGLKKDYDKSKYVRVPYYCTDTKQIMLDGVSYNDDYKIYELLKYNAPIITKGLICNYDYHVDGKVYNSLNMTSYIEPDTTAAQTEDHKLSNVYKNQYMVTTTKNTNLMLNQLDSFTFEICFSVSNFSEDDNTQLLFYHDVTAITLGMETSVNADGRLILGIEKNKNGIFVPKYTVRYNEHWVTWGTEDLTVTKKVIDFTKPIKLTFVKEWESVKCYYNGKLIITYTDGLIGTEYIGNTLALLENNGNNYNFYSVRTYSRALTEEEILINTFRDKIYNAIDLELNYNLQTLPWLRPITYQPPTPSVQTNNTSINVNIKDVLLGELDKVDTNKVMMTTSFSIPYSGVKYTVKSPKNIQIRIDYGNTSNASWTISELEKYSSDLLTNGKSYTFPRFGATSPDTNVWFYKIYFSTIDNSELTVETIQKALDSRELTITYEDSNTSVIDRNQQADQQVASGLYKFINSSTRNRNICFVHCTDIHQNGIAYVNALEYSDYIKATALLTSGDYVFQSYSNNLDFVKYLSTDYKTPVLTTIGNHDGVGIDANTLNEHIIKPFAKDQYINKGYYYKDFENEKIRVIVLDTCGDSTNTYRINYVGKTQLQWYSDTLKSTPVDYHVIVMLHQPLGNPKQDNSIKAFQDGDLANSDVSWKGADTIKAITNAFMNKENASIIMDGTSDTIDAQFGNITTQKFIMYLNGHTHRNSYGYLTGLHQNDQLQMNHTCSAIALDMQNTYQPKNEGRYCGNDTFNVYCIDKEARTVKLVKFGYTDTANGSCLTHTFNY